MQGFKAQHYPFCTIDTESPIENQCKKNQEKLLIGPRKDKCSKLGQSCCSEEDDGLTLGLHALVSQLL